MTSRRQVEIIRNLSLLLLLSAVAGVASLAAPETRPDAAGWWRHVKALAGDDMEGRETGSAGERRAQIYIVDELKRLGIPPAGEPAASAGGDGYLQTVRFVERRIAEKDSSLALVRAGKAEPLTLGDEAYFSTRIDLAPAVEAPLVFAGYGLNIPEKHYNDLDGLDLKGKIAVIFSGSPADVPAALASHYQTTLERWKALKAAGAVGMVTIPNPAAMDIPWPRMSLNRTHPSMSLVGAEFDETAGEQIAVTFNPASAEVLFKDTGHTFKEIATLGKDRKPLPRFPLPLSLRAKTRLETREVSSTNVAAAIGGGDPGLKSEYVVLSAHIDHLGIGEPIDGDRIYNGAMDNASGSALLLDLARILKESAGKPKRSVLLLWVTGEEKGLLGSKYYAAHPTVPAASIVANLNVDMFLPIVPLKVLTVYGLAESDLGDRARSVAAGLGLRVQPDPEPLRNSFIRSDQYNFIRHGVPALVIDIGFDPGSPQQAVFKDWLTKRYHAPSDDLNQPVDLAAAAGFEEMMRRLTLAVADDPKRPAWKPDSFFRRFAGGA